MNEPASIKRNPLAASPTFSVALAAFGVWIVTSLRCAVDVHRPYPAEWASSHEDVTMCGPNIVSFGGRDCGDERGVARRDCYDALFGVWLEAIGHGQLEEYADERGDVDDLDCYDEAGVARHRCYEALMSRWLEALDAGEVHAPRFIVYLGRYSPSIRVRAAR